MTVINGGKTDEYALYGDNYEIIDGAKVYTFVVDPPRCDIKKKDETISAFQALGYFCYGMVYPFAKMVSALKFAVRSKHAA